MSIDERLDKLIQSIESRDRQIEAHDRQIEAHDRQMENLNQKIDDLITVTKKISLELADRQSKTEATVERLAKIALEDKTEIRRIWEYLMNQTTNGHK